SNSQTLNPPAARPAAEKSQGHAGTDPVRPPLPTTALAPSSLAATAGNTQGTPLPAAAQFGVAVGVLPGSPLVWASPAQAGAALEGQAGPAPTAPGRSAEPALPSTREAPVPDAAPLEENVEPALAAPSLA